MEETARESARQILNLGWQLLGPESQGWLEARVPGCVHTDLLRHGLIPDPFVAENEADCRWVAERGWEYRLVFVPRPEVLARGRQCLRFLGLDTLAEVRLNGQVMLEADSMYRPWECDVSGQLHPGENQLRILFRSPVDPALKAGPLRHLEYPAENDQLGKVSPFVRKAPYHYGWDWGPALATMGIWQPVELLGWDRWRVRDLSLGPLDCSEQEARFALQLDLEGPSRGPFQVEVREPKRGVLLQQEFTRSELHPDHAFELCLPDPELWWPRGHGAQPLHELTITVREVGRSGPRDQDTVFRRTLRTACRRVELRREQDALGESFVLQVNGRPIFAKGANWIPAHVFPAELEAADYRRLLDAAAWANMNMLRVWGGGYYERDEFYDLCDELGILVWQDFMFACSLYPGHEAFLDSVAAEARHQVQRLKHHPSLALWCGNNEIAQAWNCWGWKDQWPREMFTRDYLNLFHDRLPRVLTQLDPARPYWPTSPAAGNALPEAGQDLGAGDIHYWGVWHGGDPPEAFGDNVGRFMSEYGMQSMPDPLTVRAFLPADDLALESDQPFLQHPALASHQKSSLGNGRLAQYVEQMFGPARDLETFIHLSQLTQMECLREAVEAHREKLPACAGTLYWQFNDCWPGISWSGIDHAGRWKAMHYAARRLFAPVLVCWRERGQILQPVLVHDGPAAVTGDLDLRLLTFAGDTLWQRSRPLTLESGTVKAGAGADLGELLSGHDPARLCLVAEWSSEGREPSRAHHFFRPLKDLQLPRAKYETAWSRQDGAACLQVRAGSFLKCFFVRTIDRIGHFSDNYVDLMPGEERVFKFEGRQVAGSTFPEVQCLTLNELLGQGCGAE